jgi:hypothetical protein
MRKKLLAAFAASSAVGLTIGLLSVWMMIPTPFEFYLPPQATEAQRIELRDRLRRELEQFEKLSAAGHASGLNDLDRLRPVDMTQVAHAIQVYTLDQDQLPESMEDLFASRAIAPASLEGTYTLRAMDGEWSVYSGQDYLFARGN